MWLSIIINLSTALPSLTYIQPHCIIAVLMHQSPTSCQSPSKPRKEFFGDCQSATWLLYKIYYKYLCLWIGSEQHVCLDSVWYLYSQIKNILSPWDIGMGHILSKNPCAKTANLCNSVLFQYTSPTFMCSTVHLYIFTSICYRNYNIHNYSYSCSDQGNDQHCRLPIARTTWHLA